MGFSRRALFFAILYSAPSRALTRLTLALVAGFGRLASRARFAALAPTAPRDCVLHWSAEVKCPARISWGERVIVGPGCTLGAVGGITLGDHVRLSKGAVLETAGLDFSQPPPYRHTTKPIVLENGVWVGARAMILGGVTIGQQAVIGAGAVVTRDVPPFTIVTGQPMRSKPGPRAIDPA